MGHLPNIHFQVLLLLVSGSIFLDAEIISVVVQIDFVFSWGDTNSERSVLLFLWYIQSVFFGGLGDGLKCWKRWVLWESCCFCFFFCMLEMFPFFPTDFRHFSPVFGRFSPIFFWGSHPPKKSKQIHQWSILCKVVTKPGSSKCVKFPPFHQRKLPKGRIFTYLEDPGIPWKSLATIQ